MLISSQQIPKQHHIKTKQSLEFENATMKSNSLKIESTTSGKVPIEDPKSQYKLAYDRLEV